MAKTGNGDTPDESDGSESPPQAELNPGGGMEALDTMRSAKRANQARRPQTVPYRPQTVP
jgi:hypothetical protein